MEGWGGDIPRRSYSYLNCMNTLGGIIMFKLIALFSLVFSGSVYAATPVMCKVKSIDTKTSSFVCKEGGATGKETTYFIVKGSKVSVNGKPISETNKLSVGDGCSVMVVKPPNVDEAKCTR